MTSSHIRRYFELLLTLSFPSKDRGGGSGDGSGDGGGDDGRILAVLGLKQRYAGAWYRRHVDKMRGGRLNTSPTSTSPLAPPVKAPGICGSLGGSHLHVPDGDGEGDLLLAKITPRAKEAAALLRSIQSPAVRAVSLANFAEEVVRMVLPDIDELPAFMPCLWGGGGL